MHGTLRTNHEQNLSRFVPTLSGPERARGNSQNRSVTRKAAAAAAALQRLRLALSSARSQKIMPLRDPCIDSAKTRRNEEDLSMAGCGRNRRHGGVSHGAARSLPEIHRPCYRSLRRTPVPQSGPRPSRRGLVSQVDSQSRPRAVETVDRRSVWDASPERVDSGRLRVTFVNHATTLIQMDGVNILTDPVWSKRVSPLSFAGPKRHRPPGIRFEDLPKVDAIVISHNHYDHLDLATLRRIAKRDQPRIFVPLGDRDLLTRHGVNGASTSVAIHFGTFALGDDGETEPADELRKQLADGKGRRFWVLGFGEGRDVP